MTTTSAHEGAATSPKERPGEFPRGFEPPPYPYARLAKLHEVASRHEGGVVDLSVGTPCDPPPQAVLEALATSGTERGYPSSIGSGELRSAARRWMKRRFDVDLDEESIAACVGTKEMVASTAWFLRLRRPDRDLVIVPAVAYPTYAMGAQLAGCKVFTVPETEHGVDLSSVPEAVASRALMAWLNSPCNPTGSLSDLDSAARWGRAHGVPMFSDECYVEFTWDTSRIATVLQSGSDGVVAVHSLSKRSNMAGMRVGFYAGDSETVRYLSQVRQHAGLMVPGPVQAAAVAALDDDEHVRLQRDRYRGRLELLREMLVGAGLEACLPDGGFYLWVPVPSWAVEAAREDAAGGGGAWVLAEALAEMAGALVSPGDFYGEDSTAVRVAAVQPDSRIVLVGERLARASGRGLDSAPERSQLRRL